MVDGVQDAVEEDGEDGSPGDVRLERGARHHDHYTAMPTNMLANVSKSGGPENKFYRVANVSRYRTSEARTSRWSRRTGLRNR